jgi:hypothetical protein
MPVTRDAKLEWAKIGARSRLVELEHERAAILKAFPDLRRAAGSHPALPAKPRRRLSRAARRAMSEGMRRYWAKRKTHKNSSK